MLDRRDPEIPRLDADSASPEAVCHAWYEAYGGPLYGYFRFHLPSPDQAEDLTAEVFLRALRAFDRFDPARGSPKAWLFRIAQNVLRDQLRQERRRRSVPLASLRDLCCEAPSPEERLLREEEVGRLLASVADLSPADRAIISLRYGSGLDTAEVGEILGLREPAVRTRLWRALKRLRGMLRS